MVGVRDLFHLYGTSVYMYSVHSTSTLPSTLPHLALELPPMELRPDECAIAVFFPGRFSLVGRYATMTWGEHCFRTKA